MNEPTERELRQMGDARLIAATETVIFPMIKLLMQGKVDLMCAKLRQGETSFVAEVAYITALQDLNQDLNMTHSSGNRVFEKINQGAE